MKCMTGIRKFVRVLLIAAISSVVIPGSSEAQEDACKLESLPKLPDVTIMSLTQETQFAPHCKVAGVIGPEIRFELLLPEKWNGKFVMGGGSLRRRLCSIRRSGD